MAAGERDASENVTQFLGGVGVGRRSNHVANVRGVCRQRRPLAPPLKINKSASFDM